jgi:hypothetical protein
VRREHQLDLHPVDGFNQTSRRQPTGDEPTECIVAGPALRRRIGGALVVAATANAMVLFGNVGEHQEVGERPRHWDGGIERHHAEVMRQRAERVIVTAASILRERADAFHGFEEGLAFVATERIAEQFAQEANVIAQWFMRVVHAPAIPMRQERRL